MTSLFPSPATIAARSMASKASSALSEPLLDKQQEAPTQVTVRTGGSDDDSAQEEKMKTGNILVTSLVCLMAAAGCKFMNST